MGPSLSVKYGPARYSSETISGEMIRRVTHDKRRQTWAIEHKPKGRPGYISLLEWPFTSRRDAKVLSFDRHLDAPTLSPDGKRLCFRDRYGDELLVARLEDREILARALLKMAGPVASWLGRPMEQSLVLSHRTASCSLKGATWPLSDVIPQNIHRAFFSIPMDMMCCLERGIGHQSRRSAYSASRSVRSPHTRCSRNR